MNRHSNFLERKHKSDSRSPEFGWDTPTAMLASSPQINHYAPASKGADVRITFGILVPLLMAFTTSVVHHWLLLRIEGRPVIAYSQFWIKNVDNALATIVVLLLGLSFSTSLVQVVWRILCTNPTRLATINKLFALPSILSILSLLFTLPKSLCHSIPLLLSMTVQLLFLASVIAPNALQVVPRPLSNTPLTVPALDFFHPEHLQGVITSNTSHFWQGTVIAAMVTLPENTFPTPVGCGASCSYSLEYNAPALDCKEYSRSDLSRHLVPGRDYIPHPYPLIDGAEIAVAYAGATNTPNLETPIDRDTEAVIEPFYHPTATPYNFTLGYFRMPSLKPDSTFHESSDELFQQGVSCHLRNGTYRLSFEALNNRRSIQTSLISYGEPLSDEGSCSVNTTCFASAQLTRAATSFFTWALRGEIYYRIPGLDWKPPNVGNPYALQRLFSLSEYPPREDLGAVEGLADTLVEWFGNVTLGNVIRGTGVTTVDALIGVSGNVWVYYPPILWAIYIPFLFVCSVFAIGGLYCLRANGTALEADFTTFVTTTRNSHLDQLLQGAAHLKRFEETRLRLKRRVFVVEGGDEARHMMDEQGRTSVLDKTDGLREDEVALLRLGILDISPEHNR